MTGSKPRLPTCTRCSSRWLLLPCRCCILSSPQDWTSLHLPSYETTWVTLVVSFQLRIQDYSYIHQVFDSLSTFIAFIPFSLPHVQSFFSSMFLTFPTITSGFFVALSEYSLCTHQIDWDHTSHYSDCIVCRP